MPLYLPPRRTNISRQTAPRYKLAHLLTNSSLARLRPAASI